MEGVLQGVLSGVKNTISRLYFPQNLQIPYQKSLFPVPLYSVGILHTLNFLLPMYSGINNNNFFFFGFSNLLFFLFVFTTLKKIFF